MFEEDRSAMVTSFPNLWREWTKAKAEATQLRESRLRSQIAEWEERLHEMKSAQRELMRTGRWVSGPTSILSVLGQSRRETYHCAMLAWLLTPTGRHRLGTAALRGFLDRVGAQEGLEEEDLLRAKVRTEVLQPNCRTDLLVQLPDQTIVVEAKVDAAERPDQCLDTYRDFSTYPAPTYVFLSPGGRTPVSAPDEVRSAFVSLSFREIIDLIEQSLAVQETTGGPGTGSVQNYLLTLREEFQ